MPPASLEYFLYQYNLLAYMTVREAVKIKNRENFRTFLIGGGGLQDSEIKKVMNYPISEKY